MVKHFQQVSTGNAGIFSLGDAEGTLNGSIGAHIAFGFGISGFSHPDIDPDPVQFGANRVDEAIRIWLFGKQGTNGKFEDRSKQCGAWDCEDPGPNDVSGNSPAHGRQALYGSGSDDRARYRVRGAQRYPE